MLDELKRLALAATPSLAEIIDDAKKDFATWPKWMQDAANSDAALRAPEEGK